MYEWVFNDELVREQYDTLPDDGRATLNSLLDAVILVPYNFVERPPNESHGHATTSATLDFAKGRGLVTIQVYDIDEVVIVKTIQWLG